MPRFGNRVQETTQTTGTGAYTLEGAVSGWLAFSAEFNNNDDEISYLVVDDPDAPSSWEVGKGTFNTPNFLSRDTIERSTNSDAAVNWGSGSKTVIAAPTATDLATVFGTTSWSTKLSAARSITSNTSSVAADNGKYIRADSSGNSPATLTYTMLAEATAGDGFIVTVANVGASGSVDVDDDAATLLRTLQPGEAATFRCNGAIWTQTSDLLRNGTTGHVVPFLDGNNVFSGTMRNTASAYWNKGSDIASAATLVLGTDGNAFDVTGTTTITAIQTTGFSGPWVLLQFDGALTLTHHATDLILPGADDITTQAGDIAIFYEYASGDWRCISYQRSAFAPGGAAFLQYQERLTAATTGPAFTAGAWRTVPFNTEVHDDTGAASLATDQITLPEGTYEAHAMCVNRTGGTPETRMRIVTDPSGTPAVALLGLCLEHGNVSNLSTFPIDFLTGRFSVSGTAAQRTIEVQIYPVTSDLTAAPAHNVDSNQEYYTDLRLWKVA